MQKRGFNIAMCCCTLVIGSILYIVFRPDTYVSNLFDNMIILEKLRNTVSQTSNNLLKFYLPDFLWGFSLTCGLIAILSNRFIDIFICGFIAFMYGVIWELLQLFNIVSGTFDFLDILMYLSATIVVVILNLRSFRNEKVN